MLGVGMQLQRAFRQGYSLDPRNSTITAVRGSPAVAGDPDAEPLLLRQHRRAAAGHAARRAGARGARIRARHAQPVRRPPLLAGAAAGGADGRRAAPMRASGLITQHGARLQRRPGAHAARAHDRTLAPGEEGPAGGAVRAGQADHLLARPQRAAEVPRDGHRQRILEWNKAFEKIGFKNAIVVQQQPDDADFDTLDWAMSSVRWMMSAVTAASAPSAPKHVDPRSGEILDADIGFESLSVALARAACRAQTLSGAASFAAVLGGHAEHCRPCACAIGDLAAEQLGYALDVLEARGEHRSRQPAGRSSSCSTTSRTRSCTRSATRSACATTSAPRGSTPSAAGRPRIHARQRHHRLGDGIQRHQPAAAGADAAACPSDHARPLRLLGHRIRLQADRARPRRRAELLRIAARSNEPLLAYGTDEDAAFGIDPETIQLDLGADPIAYAAKRLEIARDLFLRQERRELKPDQRLCGAAPLAVLCDCRCRARRGRAGAADRRRAHAARLPGQRPRPAAAHRRGHAAPGARADRAQRAVDRRPGGDARRCSAGWRRTSTTVATTRRCPPTTRCRSACSTCSARC